MEEQKNKKKRTYQQLLDSFQDDNETLADEFALFLQLRQENKKIIQHNETKQFTKEEVSNNKIDDKKYPWIESEKKEELKNNNNSQIDEQMERIIKNKNILQNVDPDGNCLYRALCCNLTGSQDGWQNLKKFGLMFCYIQYNQLQPSDDEIHFTRGDFYLKFIQNSVWGDIDQIGMILSRLMNKKIYLWCDNINLNRKPERVYGESQKYSDQPVMIFLGANHFQSVIFQDDSLNIKIDLKMFYCDCLNNYFKYFVDTSDPDLSEQMDEDFYQTVSGESFEVESILELFSQQLNFEFLSEARTKQDKRRSRKIDNLNAIPKNIFQKSSNNIEGFVCCKYDKIYEGFQNRKDCDPYNEKYQYLLSVRPDKPLSTYTYPQRINDIKDYKRQNKKKYEFRKSLKGYKLVKCAMDNTLRLVSVINNKLKFHLFKDQIPDFLELFHGNQHRKRDEMIEIFDRLGVFIPNMQQIITRKIEQCGICQQENVVRKRKDCKVIVSQSPFERVQIDCCEIHRSLQQNGYNQIIVIRDHFSRFTKVYPLKNKEAVNIKNSVQQFFNFGIPEILQSDNGKEFKNKQLQELCDLYDINFIHGRPYHPQSQGSVERFNRWIHSKLNVTISINKENLLGFSVNSLYVCPTMFLKSVTEECWQKFFDKNEKVGENEDFDNDNILDLDAIKDIGEDEEYELTPKSDIDYDMAEQLEKESFKEKEITSIDK